MRTSGEGIHLPNPSYWPLLTAIGVIAVFVGLMLSPKIGPYGIIAGMSLLMFSIFNWAFEPAH